MVSDVMTALEVACRRNGRVRLLIGEDIPLPSDTSSHREPFQWSVTLASRTKLGVIPDRVFALEFLDQPQGRNRVLCFLEADRATMPVARRTLSRSSFYRKLLAYEATWTQGVHQTRFGFPRFRVVTVTSSPQRVNSLVETCQRLERGQGLFLFTDLNSFQASPDVLAGAWRGGHGGMAALF